MPDQPETTLDPQPPAPARVAAPAQANLLNLATGPASQGGLVGLLVAGLVSGTISLNSDHPVDEDDLRRLNAAVATLSTQVAVLASQVESLKKE